MHSPRSAGLSRQSTRITVTYANEVMLSYGGDGNWALANSVTSWKLQGKCIAFFVAMPLIATMG